MEERALIFRDSFNEYAIPFNDAASYMATMYVIRNKGIIEVEEEKAESDIWIYYQQHPDVLIKDVIKDTKPQEWKSLLFYYREQKTIHPYFSVLPIKSEFMDIKNWMLSFSFNKENHKKFI